MRKLVISFCVAGLVAVAVFAGEKLDKDGPLRNLLRSAGEYSEENIDSFLALPRVHEGTYLYIAPHARAAELVTFVNGTITLRETLFDYRTKK